MNNTAIKLIKQQRAETGAGVQDCRKALKQSSEVYGQALRYLREKGLENRPIPRPLGDTGDRRGLFSWK